jgi:signal peptide peptidase SppA
MFKSFKKILNLPITPHKINYRRLLPFYWNWGYVKEGLKIFAIFMVGAVLTILFIDIFYFDFMGEKEEELGKVSEQIIKHLDENYFTPEQSREGCNLEMLELTGELLSYIPPSDISDEGGLLYDETSSSRLVSQIRRAEADGKIKAILLEIDSCGGSPIAAEEIAKALKKWNKPAAAYIRQCGSSAAYYAATGADIIFASKHSDVGGIGVTLSYLDNVKKNEKEGYTFNQLSSGKFKDTGNPDRPLTEEDKALFNRDIRIMNDNFIKDVAINRKLDINKVKALADGSTMLGEMAMKNGLIDRIGGREEALVYLKEKTGEELKVCE